MLTCSGIAGIRYRGFDPFEDTASAARKPFPTSLQFRYRGFDPFEDTARFTAFLVGLASAVLQGVRSV